MKKMFLWLVIVLMISASVSSHEYKLNWVVPPANASTSLNDWASNKRFQIGDTIRSKYKKDSVMQVTKEDYKQCNSSHPRFYSNTGKTRFMFDHSVPYYFISGISGHCEKGQKIIVEVIPHDRTTKQGTINQFVLSLPESVGVVDGDNTLDSDCGRRHHDCAIKIAN